MKQLFALGCVVFLTAISLHAQTEWKLDPAHAKMTFTVTHLGLSEVDGVFKNFDASITASEEDFSDAVFQASADLTTLTTNNDRRDEHLQKDDMFDTANYPTLTFKSTKLEKVGDSKFQLTGDLTMKGITKPVTLDLTLLGVGEHPRSKKQLAGFKVSGTIDRTEFSVGNMPAITVGHDVELRASGEFVMQ
jgi:polyisoprenoid-binding protein YceI